MRRANNTPPQQGQSAPQARRREEPPAAADMNDNIALLKALDIVAQGQKDLRAGQQDTHAAMMKLLGTCRYKYSMTYSYSFVL